MQSKQIIEKAIHKHMEQAVEKEINAFWKRYAGEEKPKPDPFKKIGTPVFIDPGA